MSYNLGYLVHIIIKKDLLQRLKHIINSLRRINLMKMIYRDQEISNRLALSKMRGRLHRNSMNAMNYAFALSLMHVNVI
jgi:hypothetical protein